MILHACWRGSHHNPRPVLVWLHGFLGSGEDWRSVQADFDGWPQLSIDLPGHSGSGDQRAGDFDTLCTQLKATLAHHQVQRYWLIGYSLGGRLALYYACRHAQAGLQGVVVEGAHYGLASATAREQRLVHDRRWAAKFHHQPLKLTLEEWYQQSVFADLTVRQRDTLVSLRACHHPDALACALLAMSLARQPFLLPELHRLPRLHFLCGERDHKFRQLTEQASLPLTVVPDAGHNAHRANPSAFAAILAHQIINV
ncbi:2-succinyl-6-hydroxy-2,4-cyclohexadiene-1-carboxylate synthase [Erwinia tracheiphila]|uniref:2-succinyl-6-hydroxy-2,4-cyclohexadiene-1-carboxylate synthase n=1 Tax=Erwinia tracheiphila TaxID=65700 RepID=A0A0M2KDA4_9GAMM|nr:2-succinyl-6-hydroxy-2,4-cyclohexadiene-1-carboxylate synthase [Erwinia tracheiphila]AXF76470.1 2-succinyl-6-hydroxy-2,4-cyclohexadiene-1-carboxylate synthase [Erwinia tracheiphila]EOS96213.1 2-succinyl-6-hydroxy-2,4-cyclohexadiene-1-carboxylate synthase [Erwinia tracheiphila PSU-1]KKF35213.1 2-succinyl-6-hydroxy-2,4-cyclohexadiene-1-carboxylate synthase [Erwinia tracheiphila]UIA84865.1 2-succinyl-6-hydroxy-2,4-cyclohexadiene-1-carboxylate synthase [Erwinia tracheiphila]UIA86868.1 2-succiny